MSLYQTAFGVLVRDMNDAWIAVASETQRQQIHAARLAAQRRAHRPLTNVRGNVERGRQIQERIERDEQQLGDSASGSTPSTPGAIRSVDGRQPVGAPVEVVQASTGWGAQ